MENTEWVMPFLKRIFIEKTVGDEEAQKIFDDKQLLINRPFYKYCSVTEESKKGADEIDYNIENFRNDLLFFQSPDKFNDPFDCFMGFSQIETVKDLIITGLKQQRKLTPAVRKEIERYFKSDNTFMNERDIEDQNWGEVMRELAPLMRELFQGQDLFGLDIMDIVNLFTDAENEELFKKLLQNKLTVLDKKRMIDILFESDKFIETLKQKITNTELTDTILQMTKQDMKLKVERGADELSVAGVSDVEQMISGVQILFDQMGQSISPELTEIKGKISELSTQAMAKTRATISQQCRVTCLSERMDSKLMWSHYANKHYGFCLEYDFTCSWNKWKYPDFFNAVLMLLPVMYSDKRPLVSKAFTNPQSMMYYMKNGSFPTASTRSMIYGLLSKSEDWAYEKEWRIISLDQDKCTLKLPPARKVYLGVNMEETARQKVIDIANSKKIPAYQMILAPDKYMFDYVKVN